MNPDMTKQANAWLQPLMEKGTDIGVRVLGAILLWVIGRMVIRGVLRMMDRALNRQKVDPTLIRYMDSAASTLLNIVLGIAVLSVFGVETTTFAGLLAAAGVAIGMAWSGLLANFAAGVFLLVLRPFKAGDMISAGGVVGDVEAIGLFVTAINTPDNIRTFVGNNAIFSGVIQNFSTNPHRRVELVCQLNGASDHQQAIAVLKADLAKIPNVLSNPEPSVEILEFNLNGPVLAVRPFCHNNHYWQVYFDTNRVIRESLAREGFPAAQPAMTVYTRTG